MLLDVTLYRSGYDGFFAPNSFLSNAALGQRTYYADSDELITNDAGEGVGVFSSFNLGEATVHGIDASIAFAPVPRFLLQVTGSFIDLTDIEGIDIDSANGRPDIARTTEASSLNAPPYALSLQATARELRGGEASASVRWVAGYAFAAGINVGTIPSFATLDLDASWRTPLPSVRILLGVRNLVACVEDRTCGFDRRHIEMVNMPAIGTIFTAGVRVHRE